MYSAMNALIERFRLMPVGLRILAALHVVSGLLTALAVVVPGGIHRDFAAHEVPFARWWSLGIAPMLLVIAILLLTIGIGIFRGTPWSRPLCLVPWLLMLVSTPFLRSTTADTVIGLALMLASLGMYLYRRSTVMAYYARYRRTTVA
jgi:hypothetical protein